MEIRAAENFCDPREGDRELRQRSRGDRGRPGPLGWRWYRRVYGLDNVQAGEMVEFENGVRGICRCQSQIGDACGTGAAKGWSHRLSPGDDANPQSSRPRRGVMRVLRCH
jgi:hypothetical protein